MEPHISELSFVKEMIADIKSKLTIEGRKAVFENGKELFGDNLKGINYSIFKNTYNQKRLKNG